MSNKNAKNHETTQHAKNYVPVRNIIRRYCCQLHNYVKRVLL